MTGSTFDDRAAVAGYHANLRRNVPGLTVLHRLTDQILSETVPDDGRVLVVGAGGGAELAYLARRHPAWRFDGVDPSESMLALARQRLGEHAGSTTLHRGYVDDAPLGPFDGATCLLTLHFLDVAARAYTLGQIRQRLRPGSPLLVFHHSVPPDARETWFMRSARHAAGAAPDDAQILERGSSMAAKLPALSPAEDEQLLIDAGFGDPAVFYAALSMRGWVAHAGPTNAHDAR